MPTTVIIKQGEGREVNPHTPAIMVMGEGWENNPHWEDFEANVKTYPAPGIADGTWECESVWQYQHPWNRCKDGMAWTDIMGGEVKWFKNVKGYPTRQIWVLAESKEGEKTIVEFKGTPGIWVVYTVKTDGEVTEIYILQESGGCIICVNNGDDNYDIPTDLANANLIAAAPELLEACQNALSELIRLKRYTDDKLLNQLESTIKKALNP